MPARTRRIELSVEHPLEGRGPAGTVARIAATFEIAGDDAGPSAAELAKALDGLVRDLEELVGPSAGTAAASRPERPLQELIETYRPRQRELVDLLLSDGEITSGEHALLAAQVGAAPSPATVRAPPPAAELSKVGETPIAAVPLAAEPRLPPSRPVPELLRTFQITSLRQAGAVRARRQISFAEYMALKRHFEASDGDAKPGSG